MTKRAQILQYESSDLKQKEIAHRCGCTQGFVSRVLNRKARYEAAFLALRKAMSESGLTIKRSTV